MTPASSSKPDLAVWLLVFLSGIYPLASAQSPTLIQTSAAHPSNNYKELITAIQSGQYFPDFPALPQWLDNGKRYTAIEPAAAPAKGYDIVAYDTVTGSGRTVLIAASRFIPTGATGV